MILNSKENLENSCDLSNVLPLPQFFRRYSVEESLKILKPQRFRTHDSLQQTHGIWIENSTQLPENVKKEI
jgi:hypothetical protein